MATTDTSEKGLEALIVRSLVEEAGYVQGDPKDYDRDHAVDTGSDPEKGYRRRSERLF